MHRIKRVLNQTALEESPKYAADGKNGLYS
jgi:hypothetical protein